MKSDKCYEKRRNRPGRVESGVRRGHAGVMLNELLRRQHLSRDLRKVRKLALFFWMKSVTGRAPGCYREFSWANSKEVIVAGAERLSGHRKAGQGPQQIGYCRLV